MKHAARRHELGGEGPPWCHLVRGENKQSYSVSERQDIGSTDAPSLVLQTVVGEPRDKPAVCVVMLRQTLSPASLLMWVCLWHVSVLLFCLNHMSTLRHAWVGQAPSWGPTQINPNLCRQIIFFIPVFDRFIILPVSDLWLMTWRTDLDLSFILEILTVIPVNNLNNSMNRYWEVKLPLCRLSL